jgi:multidrug resistance efflux pump
LDGRDLEAELALRRSSVEVAKARLQKLLNSPRPEEVPPVEAKMHEAEEVLKDSQVQLDLIERVKDPRAIRQEDLLRRRLAVTAAQARWEQTKADLTLLKAGAWKPDVDVARAEVAEAQRQASRIEADLDRLTVTAPISGEILQCKVHPGEYAQAGPLAQPLILIGDTSQLNVRADVDEEDAWRVQAGATATGAPRGGSAVRLRLRFVRVEPYIIPKKSLTGDSTERVDTRVMQVLFALAPGANIRPGQQLDVFIEGKQARP